jgi:hypothetical protein
MRDLKKCKLCEIEFIPIHNSQSFCSKVCQKNYCNQKRNKKRRKLSIEFSCLICGVTYIQKRKDNTTCSPSCSQKLWVKNNPGKNQNRHNGTEAKIRHKNWINNNYDAFRSIQNRYKRNKFRSDINYKFNRLMGNAIRHGINDKSFRKWESLVGYSILDLKIHLEKTLPEGITWNDYLNGGYHIDHIIPQSMYNFKSCESPEFKKCWSYRNLRIITESENLEKLSSYDIDLVKKYNIFDLLPENSC